MSIKKLIYVILVLIVLLPIIGADPSMSHAAQSHPNELGANLSPTAPWLGPEFQISYSNPGNDGNKYHPAAAYNSRHHEYLAVYHGQWADGSRYIGEARTSASGEILTYGFFSSVSGQVFQPAVAYDYTDDQYLIVFMLDPTNTGGSNSPYEIWGRICSYDLYSCTNEFLIFKWENRGFWTPRVVWNSARDEYFVIWNAMDTTTSLPSDVSGVHVSTSGVADKLAHTITSVSYPQQADIVYNLTANQYFVVWRHMYTASDWDIYGRFIKWDGSENGVEFGINVANVDQQYPAVATNSQGTYFVVWQNQTTPSNWDIVGQYLDSLGGLVGSSFPVAAGTYNAKMPDVVAAGNGNNEYLTVWEQTTPTGTAIRARRDRFVGLPGITIPLDQFEVATGGFWDNNNPVVAADPAGYFIGYEGDSIGDPTVYRNIYGRMWSPAALFLPLIIR